MRTSGLLTRTAEYACRCNGPDALLTARMIRTINCVAMVNEFVGHPNVLELALNENDEKGKPDRWTSAPAIFISRDTEESEVVEKP